MHSENRTKGYNWGLLNKKKLIPKSFPNTKPKSNSWKAIESQIKTKSPQKHKYLNLNQPSKNLKRNSKIQNTIAISTQDKK